MPPSGGESNPSEKIIAALREEVTLLSAENGRLQNLSTSMHAKHRQQGLHVRELQDKCQANSDSADEWKAKYEDLEYKLQQSTSQLAILDHRLYDAQQSKKALEEELAAFKGTSGSPGEGSEDTNSGLPGVTKSKFNDMLCELEEQRELAANRLTELERLQRQHEGKVAECAKLSMQVNDPPEELIQESPLFRSLKVQFNILYSEVKTLRTQLDESRSIIQTIRNAHLKQVEEMEANETAILSQMKSEMLSQEELYSKLRRQFDDVEADLKQVMAHNEQVLPISSEMRSLINTLQLQNKQLKNEVYRFRRKSMEAAHNHQQIADELKATQEELEQVRKAFSESNAAVLKLTEKMKQPVEAMTATATPSEAPSSEQKSSCKPESIEPIEVKAEVTSPNSSASHLAVVSFHYVRMPTNKVASSDVGYGFVLCVVSGSWSLIIVVCCVRGGTCTLIIVYVQGLTQLSWRVSAGYVKTRAGSHSAQLALCMFSSLAWLCACAVLIMIVLMMATGMHVMNQKIVVCIMRVGLAFALMRPDREKSPRLKTISDKIFLVIN
ncbi:unnamed protein product [Hymenolepis diminuta]|nr:unnamed protein product [Hymenolepis diminuta]